MINLIYHMILNIGLLLIFTLSLSQIKIIQEAFLTNHHTRKSKILLILIFSLMGILSTYSGVFVNGAIANTRVVSVMLAGILGGPQVGLAVGIIAGMHRYAIDLQGLTGLACCISTILEGVLAGWLHSRLQTKNSKWLIFWVTFAAEVMQMIIILAVAKPFDEALKLVSVISIPMIIFNSVGVVIMLIMIENFVSALLNNTFQSVQLNLDVLETCFPLLRKGYQDQSSMSQVCLNLTQLPWVVHAKFGCESEGWEVSGGDYQQVKSKPLTIQLNIAQDLSVTLTLYSNSLNVPDKSLDLLKKEIGAIVETQLKYAYLDRMNQELYQAQWDHMQTQINPHFFFNTLSTAASLCEFSPSQAYEMIVDLGDYFRKTLRKEDNFVSYEDEIETLKLYLNLEKKRFDERLEIQLNCCEELPVPIMSFMITPMMQTAIQHSALTYGKKGIVTLEVAYDNSNIQINVKTNGNLTSVENEPDDVLLLLGRRLYCYYHERAYFEVTDHEINIRLNYADEEVLS